MQSHVISSKSIVGLLLLLSLLINLIAPKPVDALALLNRKIQLGTSVASADTAHVINFDYPTASNTGSVVIEYCDNPLPAVACVER